MKFQSKDRTPGGSKQGNIAARKIKVIGVVFHISLLINPQIRQDRKKFSDASQNQGLKMEMRWKVKKDVINYSRQSCPVLLLLQSRPQDFVYSTGNNPCQCYTSTKYMELKISHCCHSKTNRYHC